MTKIKIEWLSDEHECDTCGWTYATGAAVEFDGVPCIDLEPSAYCYDGESYDAEDVFRRIIERLGHTIEEVREGE
jgi:hypothetical protein